MMHVTHELYGTELRTKLFSALRGCTFSEYQPDRIADLASGLMRGHGQDVTSTETHDGHTTISTTDYTLTISSLATTLQVNLAPAVVDPAQMPSTEALLAALIRDMIPVFNPTEVHWLDHGQTITPAEYLEIMECVTPRRVELPKVRRPRPPTLRNVEMPCCTTSGTETSSCTGAGGAEDQLLRHHFRPIPTQEDLVTEFGAIAENKFEAEPDVRRLGIWAMTGVLTTMALPIGIAIAYLNLKKGENLRLNTHVLALTGGIMVLANSSVLGTVLS